MVEACFPDVLLDPKVVAFALTWIILIINDTFSSDFVGLKIEL